MGTRHRLKLFGINCYADERAGLKSPGSLVPGELVRQIGYFRTYRLSNCPCGALPCGRVASISSIASIAASVDAIEPVFLTSNQSVYVASPNLMKSTPYKSRVLFIEPMMAGQREAFPYSTA
jgi:hypothetical protein